MSDVSHGALNAALLAADPHLTPIFTAVSTADIAAAIGVNRAQVSNLRSLTKPVIDSLRDRDSPRSTLIVYELGQTMAWLHRHLDLSAAQVRDLQSRARDFLPGNSFRATVL